jgi:ferredoxin-NADP reductase
MSVIKDQHIKLVAKEAKLEQPGFWSVYFDRPPGFAFEAGDWIDIQFENRVLNGGITYSISSSPNDNYLQITFREGISEFKTALQSIAGGEQLYISQYGNDYDFQLKKNQSSVLIAGGVGIAPFRSMLKEMYENHDKNKVSLIYLHQNEQFLFKKELDNYLRVLPNFTVSYIITKDINRKKRQKLILSLIKDYSQNFYISGPESMVENNEHLLIDAGVQIRNIRIDSFGGY